MTHYQALNDFCRRLKRVARQYEWELVGGMIRTAEGACPVTVLGRSAYRPIIWRAADNAPNHSPLLRAALLRICGLKEGT